MFKTVMMAAAIGLGLGLGQVVSGAEASSTGVQGVWILNEAASDSFKDKFKAIEKRPSGGFRDGRLDTNAGGFKRERAAQRKRFEAVRRIASAEAIDIIGSDDVTITYDGEISRKLAPNPNGRVYSASGDELVQDRFGHTLSFWHKGVLVVETENNERGLKMTERYRFNADTAQLIVSISIKPRGGESLDLVRVYERRSA